MLLGEDFQNKMPEPISGTIAIVLAIIGIIGATMKNKAILVFAVLAFLYFLGIFSNLPKFIWVIIIIIMFMWIFKWK